MGGSGCWILFVKNAGRCYTQSFLSKKKKKKVERSKACGPEGKVTGPVTGSCRKGGKKKAMGREESLGDFLHIRKVACFT